MNEKEKFKFQVGDIVRAPGFGLGKIIKTNGGEPMPIEVEWAYSKGSLTYFTSCGKFHPKHGEPVLMLIERPIKKKKVWVNLYKTSSRFIDPETHLYVGPLPRENSLLINCLGAIYISKDEADEYQSEGRIACVEIEVDDE